MLSLFKNSNHFITIITLLLSLTIRLSLLLLLIINSINYRFKYSALGAVTRSGDDSGAADQSGRKIVDDVSVQVGHDHHIELMRIGDHLHRTVVHDHRLELNSALEIIESR